MATPRTIEPGESLYKAALASMAPEMRAAFVEACLAANIREEDVINALILAQAKILDVGFTGHTRDVKTAVNQELSGLIQRLDQIQKDHVTADAKQSDALRDGIEEIRRRAMAHNAAKAQSQKQAALTYGLTALASVFLGGLGMYWLDGKRLDETAARSEARYYADEKALSTGAEFLSELNSAGGDVRYQRMENGFLRIILSFGYRTVANVDKNPPKQAVIDLEPYPMPSPSAVPVATATRHR
jgi:hypothetical protein